jgi:hypothetical protein
MDGVTTVTDRGVPPDVTWWGTAYDYAHAFRGVLGRSLCRRIPWTAAPFAVLPPNVVRCPDCALLADSAPGEITEAFGR